MRTKIKQVKQYLERAEEFYRQRVEARSEEEHLEFERNAKGRTAREVHKAGFIMGVVETLRAIEVVREHERRN
jgi:hypothetical protein